MLNRLFVVDSVTLTSTGTAVSSYTPWDQTTRKLPTQVVVKATGQGAYVRLSNDNSAATNADVLVQGGDHVVLSVQGRRWVSVLSDGASSTVNVGALSTGVSGSAASLDLVFVDAGVLDPRVTFTRASTATYFNSAGVLTSAAINESRRDFDPATLAVRGLLIEEARTNSITWSESLRTRTLTVSIISGTFTNGETVTATGGGSGTYISADSTPTSFAIFNATGTFSGTLTGVTSGATATISGSTINWLLTNATVTPNATTTPNGTTTADKLIENTANSVHSFGQGGISFTSGVSYTATVFAKASERTKFIMGFGVTPAFSSFQFGLFDLVAGTASTFLGSPTLSIQSVGNGWYRCSVTTAATATALDALSIQLYTTSNSYTGDGTSGMFFWGGQLEAGAFPTSYIPTTTTALTRSADVASVNTLSPWFNASEGTIYFEGSTTNTGEAPFLTLQNSGLTEFFRYSRAFNQSRLLVTVASGTAADLYSGNTTTLGAVLKTAGVYKVNDFANVLNAGTVVVDPSGAVPTVTTLQLGSGGFLGSLGGYIRRITYYPRKLSSAELQAITA